MQGDNEIRKDINEVKNDLNELKRNFNHLINILRSSIPGVKELIPDSGTEHSTDTEQNQNYVAIFDNSLIKSSHIQNLISECEKNICSCKEQGLFVEFCYYVAGLIEETNKAFLRKKFRELQNEENKDLIDAYDLLEQDTSKPWEMPNLHLGSDEVRKLRQQYGDQDDNYYFDGEQYLSLEKLEKAKAQFLFEICFILLFKKQFYEQKSQLSYPEYIDKTKKQKQTISAALQRKPKKVINPITSLNMGFYVRLDNTRRFRNIYAHNKNDKNKRNEELQKLKAYVKVDQDNYNGIVEAAQWLLIQIGCQLGSSSD